MLGQVTPAGTPMSASRLAPRLMLSLDPGLSVDQLRALGWVDLNEVTGARASETSEQTPTLEEAPAACPPVPIRDVLPGDEAATVVGDLAFTGLDPDRQTLNVGWIEIAHANDHSALIGFLLRGFLLVLAASALVEVVGR